MTSVFQLFFFFLLITLRRKHQICVWLGKWELGGFQLQCDCSPSAVPPYWRGYDGVRAGAAGQCSGTAETASSRGRSWNTTPRLLTLLLSVSHIFSPLLLTLPLFYLRFWSFLTLHHHHLASIHPTPLTLCGLASHWIPPTPLLLFQWSAAEGLWPHLNIWMYINLLLAGAWSRFTAAQLWWCYGTICAGLIELATS